MVVLLVGGPQSEGTASTTEPHAAVTCGVYRIRLQERRGDNLDTKLCAADFRFGLLEFQHFSTTINY